MSFIDELTVKTLEQVSVEMAVKAKGGSEQDQKNSISVLKKMGFTTGAEVNYFAAELEANPTLKKVFSNFEKDFLSGTQDAALAALGKQVIADGQKIKFDTSKAKQSGTGVIDKLAADLKGTQADKFTKELRENPNLLATKIAGYAAGTLTMTDVLAQPAGQAAPPPEPKKEQPAAAPAPVKSPAAVKPAPAAAPVAAPIAAPAAPPAGATATPPQPAAGASAPPATGTQTQASTAASEEIKKKILTALAGASDEDIAKKFDQKDALLLADGIADKALSLGVHSPAVDGFRKAIRDPNSQLGKQITQNLKNNPDFIRSMAKMGKDDSSIPKEAVQQVTQEMHTMMANPHLLADDKHVKGLQAQIESAEALKKSGLSGFLGMMKGWASALFAPLKAMFANFGTMLAGFTGQHKVFSTGNDPSSMLGFNMRINMDAMERNRNEAMAFSRMSPDQMTALGDKGPDGRYFHNGKQIMDAKGNPVLDKAGKPTFEQVPNGQMVLKGIDRQEYKVIPAVGAYEAQQLPGTRGPDGKYIPGAVRMVAITEIDEKGASSKLASIVVSQAEFERYKVASDAAAQKNAPHGAYTTVALNTYTEDDFLRAEAKARQNVTQFNPQTGSPMQPVATANPYMGQNMNQGVTAFKLDRNGDLVPG